MIVITFNIFQATKNVARGKKLASDQSRLAQSPDSDLREHPPSDQ